MCLSKHRCPSTAAIESGWPLACLQGVRCRSFDGHSTVLSDQLQGAIELPQWTARIEGFEFLPLRPLWAGVITNGAVFSAIGLILLRALGYWRRSLRRRRGLCPSCRYDLRGSSVASQCPECSEPAVGFERANTEGTADPDD